MLAKINVASSDLYPFPFPNDSVWSTESSEGIALPIAHLPLLAIPLLYFPLLALQVDPTNRLYVLLIYF